MYIPYLHTYKFNMMKEKKEYNPLPPTHCLFLHNAFVSITIDDLNR